MRPRKLHELITELDALQKNGVVETVISAYVYEGEVDFFISADMYHEALLLAEELVRQIRAMRADAEETEDLVVH